MSELPKLKIRKTWDPVEEVCELEQARNLPFDEVIVFTGRQRINSFEELFRLASEERNRHEEFLELTLMTLAFGG
jgi:ATP:corrinoid adenosyltransferase